MKKIEVEVHETDRDVCKQIAAATLVLVEKKKAETGEDPTPTSAVFSAAMSGVQTERFRILTILDGFGREAADAMRLAVSPQDKNLHRLNATTTVYLMNEVSRDPAGCPTCKGRKVVPSTLVPGAEVPCKACDGTGKGVVFELDAASAVVDGVAMPSIDGFVPQCENCDEAAEPEDPVEYSPTPVKRGLCSSCKAGRH